MRPYFVIAVAAAFLCGVPAFGQLREVPAPSGGAPREADLYMGGFDGTWVGKLRTIAPAAYDAAAGSGKEGEEFEYAIVAAGQAAKVYLRSDGKWREVKPGIFRIAAHKTNATVIATDSARDVRDTTGNGGWVETWSFVLTHKTDATLYVVFWRAVNNYLKKPDEKNARFFRGSFGEMQKVPAVPN